MRTNAAIGIVFNQSRTKVLLVKRQDVPVWVLPGGGVDQGELSTTTVVREVLEETGLNVKVIRKVAEYTPINNLARFTEIYECQPLQGVLKKGAETKEVAFFSLHQLPKHLFFIHKEWLEDALKNRSEIIQRSLNQVTYWNLIKFFLKHPSWVIRFFATLAKQ